MPFWPGAPAFAAAREVLDQAVGRSSFPAAVAEVGTADGASWQYACGRLSRPADARAASLDTVFDLASLTKVLATGAIAMRQVDEGSLDLDEPVASRIASWREASRLAVTVRDLLSHCSGLPAHAPLFERHEGREAFARAISALPLVYAPRTRSVYSDLGFILLGFLLEREGPLDDQLDRVLDDIGAVGELRFRPPSDWRDRTAPTREDPWRRRLLVGEVDDDNAWALGGVAGHAGMFGTAAAVGRVAQHLLGILAARPGVFARPTVEAFITRRDEIPASSRALAWDTMLPTSSCGTQMSPRAFGHTGSTGTSLWIDPDAGVYAVLLTNRVHPNRDNEDILRVRPAFHDAVFGAR